MIFTETKLPGAYVVSLDKRGDERGFFARAWCQREFEEAGLSSRVVQCNMSFNAAKGTLRGMHFQRPPAAETKLIRCIRGALYDVIVDLRRDSPTYKEWIGVELTADNRELLVVPEGFAHGFVTLMPDTETYYQVSEFYTPGFEGGVRYDDPAFGIDWPITTDLTMSDKDRSWPAFDDSMAIDVPVPEGRTA